MKFYYADAQNQTAGPVTLEELQALIKAGTVKNDPMVVLEGRTDWKPLSATPVQPASAPSPVSASPFQPNPAGQGLALPFNRTILGDYVGKLLELIAARLNEGFVTRAIGACRNAGHLALLTGGLLGVIYCLVTAIKNNQLMPALVGIGFVVALAVGQFAATRLLEAGDTLIANTPHRVSSKAILDCIALVFLLAALGVLVSGVIASIAMIGNAHGDGQAWGAAIGTGGMAVIMAAILLLNGALLLNLKTVNTSVEKAGSGEEAIGLIGCLLKPLIKLSSVGFLALGVAANFEIIRSFSSSYGGYQGSLGLLSVVGGGYAGLGLLIFACLLPLVCYLVFLLLNLQLEIAKAILSLMDKQSKTTV
jgi:hypothetical protein